MSTVFEVNSGGAKQSPFSRGVPDNFNDMGSVGADISEFLHEVMLTTPPKKEYNSTSGFIEPSLFKYSSVPSQASEMALREIAESARIRFCLSDDTPKAGLHYVALSSAPSSPTKASSEGLKGKISDPLKEKKPSALSRFRFTKSKSSSDSASRRHTVSEMDSAHIQHTQKVAELEARLAAAEELANNAVEAAEGWRMMAVQAMDFQKGSTAEKLKPSHSMPACFRASLGSQLELEGSDMEADEKLCCVCKRLGGKGEAMGHCGGDCFVDIHQLHMSSLAVDDKVAKVFEDPWVEAPPRTPDLPELRVRTNKSHDSTDETQGGGKAVKRSLRGSLDAVSAETSETRPSTPVTTPTPTERVETPSPTGDSGTRTQTDSAEKQQDSDLRPGKQQHGGVSMSSVGTGTTSPVAKERQSSTVSGARSSTHSSHDVRVETDIGEVAAMEGAEGVHTQSRQLASAGLQTQARVYAETRVQADLADSPKTKPKKAVHPSLEVKVQLRQQKHSMKLLEKEFNQVDKLQKDTETQRREYTARYAFCVLDEDHDGYIRTEQVALLDMFQPWSPKVLDIALRRWRSSPEYKGYLTEDDFVSFVHVADDRSTKDHLRFWFNLIDGDGNGLIGPEDAKCFYDKVAKREKGYMIDFHGLWNQIIDMVGPKAGKSAKREKGYMLDIHGLWHQIIDMVGPEAGRRGFTCSELVKCKLGSGVTGLLLNHRNMLVQRTTLEPSVTMSGHADLRLPPPSLLKRGVQGAILTAALCATTLQQPAMASTIFSGVYADPNHPKCERTIDEDGVIRGVDPVPFARGSGCAPGISASTWKIEGNIASGDASIFINFDEKDGSGEAFDGVFDRDQNGLLLPDGTLWKKVAAYAASSPIPGDYDDSSHPGCIRRVLPSGAVQGEDPPGLLTPGSKCMPGDKTNPWELEGSIVGNELVINFDPIDEVKTGPILAVYKDNTLRTANGLWTKK
eukprot:gene30365-35370_t